MQVLHLCDKALEPGGVARYLEIVVPALVPHGVSSLVASNSAQEAGPDVGALYRGDEELVALIRRHRPDLLHTHQLLPPAVREAIDVPVVRTVHGHELSCPSRTKFYARGQRPCPVRAGPLACATGLLWHGCGLRRPGWVAERLRDYRQERRWRAPVTIALSDYVAAELLGAGLDPASVRRLALPCPVGPRSGDPGRGTDAPPRILFSGRISPSKGLHWLVGAVARTEVAVVVEVAGEGRDRARVEALAADLGVRDRMRFHGWLEPDPLGELRAACTMAVVPALWHEPAGFTPLEAMAAGLPTVVSDVGALGQLAVRAPEAVVAVAPGDTEALAGAIDRVALDPLAAARLAGVGRDLVAREHRVEDHAAELAALYRTQLA